MPKFIVVAFGLIVNVAVTSGLSFKPGEDAIALMVVVEVTDMGVEYWAEL
jgi:hypothetical protein